MNNIRIRSGSTVRIEVGYYQWSLQNNPQSFTAPKDEGCVTTVLAWQDSDNTGERWFSLKEVDPNTSSITIHQVPARFVKLLEY